MELQHQHDLIFITQCPEVNCNETYLRETARGLWERVLDHAGKDRKSNMVKHNMDTGHPPVCMKDFQILTKRFNHCKFMRKICKKFLIKKHRPTLNAQEHSVTLELFNWNRRNLNLNHRLHFYPRFLCIETSLSIYLIIWLIGFCIVKSLTGEICLILTVENYMFRIPSSGLTFSIL